MGTQTETGGEGTSAKTKEDNQRQVKVFWTIRGGGGGKQKEQEIKWNLTHNEKEHQLKQEMTKGLFRSKRSDKSSKRLVSIMYHYPYA